jgi:hypothetical protein
MQIQSNKMSKPIFPSLILHLSIIHSCGFLKQFCDGQQPQNLNLNLN